MSPRLESKLHGGSDFCLFCLFLLLWHLGQGLEWMLNQDLIKYLFKFIASVFNKTTQ